MLLEAAEPQFTTPILYRYREYLIRCTERRPRCAVELRAKALRDQRMSQTDVTNTTELFELIVESALDFAIFTTDSQGITTSWNVGAERLFGYKAGEILGLSADVIFTEEDRQSGAPEGE